jgi:hypothetical protein
MTAILRPNRVTQAQGAIAPRAAVQVLPVATEVRKLP